MTDQPRHRPWGPEGDRTRVLMEIPASSSPSVIADMVERHGFEVRTCEGPGDRGGCDLIDHGACALVSGADVVVNMLHAGDAGGGDVLDAVIHERRPPAVVAEFTQPHQDRATSAGSPATPEQAWTVLTTPVTSKELLAGISEAADRAGGSRRRS